ncbi:MAG: RecQ family ATP-dependent DNA helicase [Nostoc sp. DedQUE12b]|jgi:ATP-dependent DNA helicase RecQ|uniref:RecQ family ATP-dependent DNA helicase n=1 Tax=Nostoc sp. DedQUE12b TaxID=3075398 RepID=UPI002AD435AD|nr:RecQ family ATP-dependent DNA helicase [Nostoc sp. DedQUE12b]MDZ8084323.1 RecQ family ATP-dependent DNA helicase [Nostoc sp. DedQUE12b]
MNTKAKEVFEKEFPALAGVFSLKLFQEKVINHLIENGSTLAVMPTGGGKSLIYWVTAKALKGTCLVISPLIALIDEQAEKLEKEGFEVLAIHSGMGVSEQMKQLKKFAKGESKPDFIFASPERMATDGFFEYCISLQINKIKLVVIDEVHCISQWGFDFRPFYKHIPTFLNSVFSDKWPTILGLTATINPKELIDITTDFKIKKSSIIKDDVLLRFDIDLKVEKLSNEEEKKDRLWQIIDNHTNEKVLVYLYRKYHKGGVEDLCETANQKGLKALSFHGDMSSSERQSVLNEFRDGSTNLVFATNAFGMGIDIPNIRVVIHFMIPESIEQYYQEIGRSGRDQNGAISYMLYSNKNVQVRKTHFIDKSFPQGDQIKELFKKATNNEVGKKTLQYFAEEELQSALPYFLNCGAITIEGKGFTGLKVFKTNSNPMLKSIIESTRTGMVVPVLLKPEFSKLTCREFFNITYKALVDNEAKLAKNLDKCLIIEATKEYLTDEQIETISNETASKREYKHNLLDYLVYLLDNFDSSISMHQDIGRYLGVSKHSLNKIHQAENGIWVRSKSEVIIANILYHSNIDFQYEEKLFYNEYQWKEPDFTIRHNGNVWYWEHLGLLGNEQYNENWQEKKEIYKELGVSDKVLTTKESAVLSNQVNELVKKIKMT